MIPAKLRLFVCRSEFFSSSQMPRKKQFCLIQPEIDKGGSIDFSITVPSGFQIPTDVDEIIETLSGFTAKQLLLSGLFRGFRVTQ